MRTHFYRIWGLDYLLAHPWEWERRTQKYPWLREYEVLDLTRAKWALDEIAREPRGRELVRELAPEALLGVHPSDFRWPAGSYEAAQTDEQMLARLKEEALGTIFSKHGEPPHMAKLYICKRKRIAPKPEPLPDPWKDVREAIEAAKQAPRGFVMVEAVTEAGDPVPHMGLEVLLTDGEVLTRATDAQGQLRLEPIPQGRCTIRVPALDGNVWHPGDGGSASRVDRGHKRLHIVQKGENLARIAQQYGFKGWSKLWEAPDNEELRKKRRSPHVLRPGDQVVVPAPEIREIVRPTDQTHRIVVTEELVEFRVVLQDHNQQPFANEPYELRVVTPAKDAPRQGTTDGAGKVVEQLSAAVQNVEIRLPEIGLAWRFLLSDFVDRPADEAEARRGKQEAVAETVKATQLRLNALGFPCGEADGGMGTKTYDALALSGQQSASPETQPEHVGERALAALDHVEPLFTGNV